MKYGLTNLSGGSPDPLDITEEQYAEIRDAKAAFLGLTGLEEKMDLLIENYLQYERTLLELTLQQMLLRDHQYPDLIADMCSVNLRVLNLLAAARLYVDQLHRDISRLYSAKSSQFAAIREKCRAIYDSSLGYRVAEALRNHIQHHSLPVTRLSYPSSVVDPDGDRRLQFGINPFIDVAQLRQDGDFKVAVLKELEAEGQSILLTPRLREYVSGLGSLHEEMRKTTKPEAERWQALLSAAIERARTELGETVGFAVVEIRDDGTYGETHQVFDDLLKVHSLFLRRNGSLGTLSRRFVSGDIIRRDA